MNKFLAVMFSLILVVVLVSGCVGQSGNQQTNNAEELTTEEQVSSEISELDTLQEEIDDSSLEDLEADLSEINWE